MIALNLTDAKKCMSQLLLSNTFDAFYFIEGEIVTFNTFTFDGFLQRGFFEEAPPSEYSLWKDLRDFCFQLIKGKRTPLSFKFVFRLSPENTARLLTQSGIPLKPEDVQGLYLNIRYNGSELQCITGTSVKVFTLDKTLEQTWDNTVQKFFQAHEIQCEPIQ
ncbi:MAG: DUF5721 family protein [Hespellia sp.]|nr:DUF5721 family protein [Hespellia sp.]